MTGAVALIASVVPVPNLGPGPGTFEPGWVEQALLVLAMLGVLFFVAVVFTTKQRVERGGSLWGPAVLGIALMALPLIPVAILEHVGRARSTDAISEYTDRENQLADEVKVELEQAFGISYVDDYPYVPLDDGDYSREMLVLPDGSTAECFTVAEDDGYYRIRCGGDRPEDGTELEPVAP